MHSRLPRGVRPRLEGKQRTALSSRAPTRISWSPLSRLKGIHPNFSLERGLGIALQARQEKKALSSPGRGRLRGFLELRRPWGFSHEARRGCQGASRVAPGKSGLHARGEGECLMALESWEGIGLQDALKKDSRGLSRVVAGNPRFPRLLPGTLGNFPGCL